MTLQATWVGHWFTCGACDVRWVNDDHCWVCGGVGDRCYRPSMLAPATWNADRNDPLEEAA